MKTINFLRGVPAEEALQPVAEALSEQFASVLKKYGPDVIQYQRPGLADFNGFVPLKQTLAKRYGIQGDAQSRVICTNGGMESFSLFIKSFPRVCKIATDAMTYDRVLSDIVTQGHQAVGVAMTEEGVDLDQLESALKGGEIKVFYQVAYHHNPTGITTTCENLDSAAQLCASYGVLHCLDVAYYELRYDGEENRLVELDKYPETSCLVGSFTKTLSPGAKCGFGIFPEAIVKQMTPVVADTRLNPNYPTQAAINQLFETGFYDRHLASLQELYKPRMDAMNEGIESLLPGLGTPHLTGGFFQGLWLVGLREEQPFLESLKAKGVLLAPANVFAPGWKEKLYQERSGVFFRLTFPALSIEENSQGIELIAETFNEMK